MIEANGGVVFSTGGDGFAAAFADAAAAVRAAVDAQERVRLPVRMGLHTGTAEERDGNYFGRTLNRAARIMAAGHGGQIVLSDVTAGLVRDEFVRDRSRGASPRGGGAGDAAVAGRRAGVPAVADVDRHRRQPSDSAGLLRRSTRVSSACWRI